MKTPPKSSAEIYRKAAELIEKKGELCCCPAIEYIAATRATAEHLKEYFAHLFEPRKNDGVFDAWWINEPWIRQQSTEPRILALLLAAEIVERGGL